MGRLMTEVTMVPSVPRPWFSPGPPSAPVPTGPRPAAGSAAPAAATARLGMMRTLGPPPAAPPGAPPGAAPAAPPGAPFGDGTPGPSDIDARLHGVALDELPARLHRVAHQGDEDLVGEDGVVDGDLQQRARLRVHRGLPELLRVHLAETLVALHRDALAVRDAPFGEDTLLGLVVEGVTLDGAFLELVERRLRDVHVPARQDGRHVSVEERQKQRADVGAVDVGIRH